MVWFEIFRFMHLIGLALGVGGATIASVISAKSEKDKNLGREAMKIIPSISKIIWIGLLLLIISGIGISLLIKWPINRELLIIKHVLVVWLIIFGVAIGTRIRKMKKATNEELIKVRKQIKTFSKINLILWYLITLMSVFI